VTWRLYDPEIFDLLRSVSRRLDNRRLTAVEQSGLLPHALFINRPIVDDLKGRSHYFQQAREELAGCDVVFFDPDNGLDVPSVRKGHRNSSKYLYMDEVASFWAQGSSVVVYQHYPFENHDSYTARIARRIGEFLPGSYVHAFRTAHVAFYLASQSTHENTFAAATSVMSARWPASFIRADERPADWTPARGSASEQEHAVAPLDRAETSDWSSTTKSADICEARQLSGNAWEVISIDEALTRRNLVRMRCIECKGEVRPHKAARNGAFRPHFEHRVRHDGCSRCNRGFRARRPHPSPAR
jgi:hypothetical protein